MLNEWWSERADEVEAAAQRRGLNALFGGTRLLSRELGSLPRTPSPRRRKGTQTYLDEMAAHFAGTVNAGRPVNWQAVHDILALVAPVAGC